MPQLKQFDLVVVDAGGFTFGFTYVAETPSEARQLFFKRLRTIGKKTRKIKIKDTELVGDAEPWQVKGSAEGQKEVPK